MKEIIHFFNLDDVIRLIEKMDVKDIPSNMASLPLSAAPGPLGLTGNFTVIS